MSRVSAAFTVTISTVLQSYLIKKKNKRIIVFVLISEKTWSAAVDLVVGLESAC